MKNYRLNEHDFYIKEEPSTLSLLWSATKFLSKSTWFVTKFVVKNTPTALGIAWQIKQEITNEIATSIQEERKAQKERLLEEQIASLQMEKQIASKKLEITHG